MTSIYPRDPVLPSVFFIVGVKMGKEDVLGRTALFGNISEKNLTALADICLSKSVNKKEIIFFEGDKGYSLYLLVEGNIQLYKTTAEGKDVVIKVVKPGELFAEVILFEKDEYPVNAVALKQSLVYMIPKFQFSCLLENDKFRTEFIGILMKKMRYLADQIQYLTTYDVEDRLLMFLEEQYGRQEAITCTLSKKAVAGAIGTTPETLSRVLLRMKSDNKLIWEGKKVTVSREVWGAREDLL